MANIINTYNPDYSVPPGWVLAGMLEENRMSQAEFARCCGRSAKMISDIITGQAPLTPETALQFEYVLGMDADVWLSIGTAHQLARAKEAEEEKLKLYKRWAQKFPLADLTKHGVIESGNDNKSTVSQILSLFNVGSPEAWENKYGEDAVAYRKSSAFKSSPEAVAAWLRVGELKASGQTCMDYDVSTFKKALPEIRELTNETPKIFIPKMTQLCNASGVAFVLVPGFSRAPISGAARWINPQKALILQSLRHKTNDHFWFTFFHEVAHLLLHSKKNTFVDENGENEGKIEDEANSWAENLLIPQKEFQAFIEQRNISSARVRVFAKECGIAPGILVGALQHRKCLAWNKLNNFKKKYIWK